MQILRSSLKLYRKQMWGAAFAIMIASFASLGQPWLLQLILKAVMANNRQRLIQQGIALILLALIGIVAGILNVYFASQLAQQVTSDLRAQLYEKIQSFSFGNIAQFSAGSLVVRLINDMNQVTNLMMTLFMQLLRIPIILVGAFTLGMMTLPRFWWLLVLMLVLLIAVGFVVMTQMQPLFGRFQKIMDHINTRVKETLQGVRVVKSFNQQAQESRHFNQASDQLNQLNIQIGYWFSAIVPAFMLIAYLVITAIIYLIGQSIQSHPNDIAAVSSYVSYVYLLLFAVMIGGMVLMSFSRGLVSLHRIQAVLETRPEVIFAPEAISKSHFGGVEFDQVSFTYPGNQQPTLKQISFKAQAGQIIGIVGKTGSGKTTLAQLIARLYDPSQGVVKLDGTDLRQIDEKSLRRGVSYVLQKPILFSGTIESNLRQGNTSLTSAQLEGAIEMSQAKEFIDRYPDGLAHEVSERGTNLSGGQKQRLAIARGLVRNAGILILDDATSALDAQSEKRVRQALAHDLKQTTTFIIAEKIISVMAADLILVLADGRLVAQGTHQDLLAKSEVYREIYATQQAQES